MMADAPPRCPTQVAEEWKHCCTSFCLSWLRASLETGVEGGVHTMGLLTFPECGDSGCSEDMARAVWDLSQVQTLEWNVLAI